MCYTCSTNYNCGNSCGFLGGALNSLFNNTQYICRDCCGNVRVNPCHGNTFACNRCSRCGYNRSQSCCHGCGNANTNANGNSGSFACVTYCGNYGANTANVNTMQTSQTNGGVDYYYARQYGLCGYRNRCSCGGSNAYQSFTVED